MIYITQYHEYFERKKKITSPDKYFTSKPIYFHRSVYHSRILFLPEKGKVEKKKKNITRSEFLLGANHSESFAATTGFRYAE